MDLRKLIKEYLEEATLMQLSTCVNNKPWVCSVWFVADEELNIYFFSSINRRHSKELVKNNNIAAGIVLPQTPKDLPRGLQLEGKVKILTRLEEIDKAIKLYSVRIFPKDKIKKFMDDKQNPHCFYKIKPSLFVLFDIVNFPDNSRQEYKIS